jgi:hypothetical protein
LAKLPPMTDAKLLAAIARMQPIGAVQPRAWTLGERNVGYFVVALGSGVSLDLHGETGKFRVHRVEAATGRILPGDETVEAGGAVSLAGASGPTTVVWLTR